jgi:hypothetical protein
VDSYFSKRSEINIAILIIFIFENINKLWWLNMHRIAVVGAGTLPGRELVKVLEACDCSVLPLSCGVMTRDEELGDLVIFEPQAALLDGIDLVIIMESLTVPELLVGFSGCILDFRIEADISTQLVPLTGAWPKNVRNLRARPVLEQVLALIPKLVKSVGDISGTHLQSVAYLGDRGVEGLMEQTVSVLKGENPDLGKLGYRGAFELVPSLPIGRIMQVRVPSFHGDLLILHIKTDGSQRLSQSEKSLKCVEWRECPPTSREVAVNSNLLAYINIINDGQEAILTLGFDPILWGVLRPVLGLLGLDSCLSQ